MKDAILSGIAIKYKIPAFSPLAGPSPNCCAVFVHTAHCAFPDCTHSKTTIKNIKEKAKRYLFIACKIWCKGNLKNIQYSIFTFCNSFDNNEPSCRHFCEDEIPFAFPLFIWRWAGVG
jgi:hypothetical protein